MGGASLNGEVRGMRQFQAHTDHSECLHIEMGLLPHQTETPNVPLAVRAEPVHAQLPFDIRSLEAISAKAEEMGDHKGGLR